MIITLENYWPDYGGIDARLKWEGLPGGSHANRAKFYTNEGCKNSYMNYAKHWLTRVNTVTKVAYKDDPTIFAWELMNEPRYQDAGEDRTGITFRRWVDTMGGFIKSLDRNHMLAIGIEGHGTAYKFGGDEGNPFIYVHQSSFIDFTTGHMYPDESWSHLSPADAAKVVALWVHDSHTQVKKPFVLEEYNCHKDKDSYWKTMLGAIESQDGGGDNFWNFVGPNEGKGDYDVYQGHPILGSAFKPHADKMNNKH